MDQQRTIQDVLNYMNTPAGLGAQLARGGGEMRAPVNDRMVSAGSAMKQFPLTQSMGGAVEKLGQGMRLEPRDYAGAAMEGAALLPGGGAARMGAKMEIPKSPLPPNFPKQISDPINYELRRNVRGNALYIEAGANPRLAARLDRQRWMQNDLEKQIQRDLRSGGDIRSPANVERMRKQDFLRTNEERRATARFDRDNPWQGTPYSDMAANAAVQNALGANILNTARRNEVHRMAGGPYNGEQQPQQQRSLNDALRTPNAVR